MFMNGIPDRVESFSCVKARPIGFHVSHALFENVRFDNETESFG
jgi:hypothetical protein